MKTLYINSTTRKNSRTKLLADYLIKKIGGEIKEFTLAQTKLMPFDEAFLRKRQELISKQDFNNEIFTLAKEFSLADTIVIAAPYWDLSFPSMLKVFFEHINVLKLVFDYTSTGEIISLCKAQKLYYVTTKGGYGPDDFGFKYIETLSKTFYGVNDVVLIKAEGLDIFGNNVDKILAQSKENIDKLF